MPEQSQSVFNPCSLEGEDKIPAKIWELLRRNTKFRSTVERLCQLDSAARSEDRAGPRSAWEASRQLVASVQQRHGFAGVALQWLVPEPVFCLTRQTETGCEQGMGLSPDPAHPSWRWWAADDGDSDIAHFIVRGPTIDQGVGDRDQLSEWQSWTPGASLFMGDIAKLLDASITGVDMPAKPAPVMDLSKIDFEALRRRFKESKHRNTDLEILKAAIRAQLEKLIRLNKTRMDFQEKFEELIESYNAGSRNIEELFEELLKLSRNLSEEQHRHVRENLTEEELVIFDILTRPAPGRSADERAEVKKVARELLARIKQLLVLNWRQKSSARAQLRLTIEDVLDTGLPRVYSPELYERKCSAIFEHVYESYPERDGGCMPRRCNPRVSPMRTVP